jgi:hypothetical protein
VLVVGIAGQTVRLRRSPLPTLPEPRHRITGEPQTPNGALVTAGSSGERVSDGAGLS